MKVNNWEWGDIVFLGVTIVIATALLAAALWMMPDHLNWEKSGIAASCNYYWEPWRCER